MQYRNLGNSGLKVSRVSLGSWLTFGSTVDLKACRKSVHLALEKGINLIDTADVYALGKAEEALGEALRGVPRKDFLLASKCYFPTGDGPNDRGLSRKHVFESIHASLKRLCTEYLDLYQCHRFDPETPLPETLRAMDDLCRQGKTLYWGVSEWTADQIRRACRICEEEGWSRPISNQPVYNLFRRGIEEHVIPACEEEGLGQIVYSPLAQGVLTGKYEPGSDPPPGSRAADGRVNHFIGGYMGEAHLRAACKLKGLAERVGVPPAALTLAWCLRMENVASVIVGVTKESQLLQNLACIGLELSAGLLEEIEGILQGMQDLEG